MHISFLPIYYAQGSKVSADALESDFIGTQRFTQVPGGTVRETVPRLAGHG
jgi:hypothetical protein